MDSSEASLNRIVAQRSMDVSHDQRKGRYFPMNLINKLGLSQSKEDGATPPVGDIESGLEFLNNLKLSDLFDLPDENVQMNPEIFTGVRHGKKECLEKMRSLGTRMACLKSDGGDSILHLAATWGHLELVKNIVTECPCLLLEPNSKDQIPLHVAAHAGRLAVVEALVASVTFFSDRLAEEEREKLNPYVLKDRDGNTALHLAIEGSYMEMATCLVNANQGASFLANNEGISSLYMAVEAGDVSLVKAILKTPGITDLEGKNSNLDSKLQGRRYLAHVALKAKCTGVLDVILNKYPSLEDERDEGGRNCLSFGASIGFYEGVCFLLDRSTKSVYVCDKDGSFPIHKAAEKGHIRIVKEFLKRCPDSKHLLNKLGQNIIHIAAVCGNRHIVNFVMRDKNTRHMRVEQDVDGNTPLHLATLNWRSQCIRVLAGDTKVQKLRNNNGLTARDIVESVLKPNYIFRERLTLAVLLLAQYYHGVGSVKSITKPSKPLDHDKNRDYINTLLLVAALVATMTFAAGFTIPGGFNSSSPHLGRATLAANPTLCIFLLLDIMAMQSAVATIGILIWAQLGDPSLVSSSLNMALPLLFFALLFTPLAFLFGIITAVGHVKWLLVIICIISYYFFYWAVFRLGPHILLQLPNVSPFYGGFLMDMTWEIDDMHFDTKKKEIDDMQN